MFVILSSAFLFSVCDILLCLYSYPVSVSLNLSLSLCLSVVLNRAKRQSVKPPQPSKASLYCQPRLTLALPLFLLLSCLYSFLSPSVSLSLPLSFLFCNFLRACLLLPLSIHYFIRSVCLSVHPSMRSF